MQAEQILGPKLAPLFCELPINDQRHGLDVLRTVSHLHADASVVLRQAALLHDSGKRDAHFSVIDRSLMVFLSAVSPGLLQAMLSMRPGFAERFKIYKEHARVGADRLRELGESRLADIVAEHHATAPQLAETVRLQEADRRH